MTSTTNDYRHHLEKKIDEFENEMIQMIKDITIDARRKLHHLTIQQTYDENTRGSDLDRIINRLEQIKEKLIEITGAQNNEADVHRNSEISINESEQTGIVSNDHLKLKLAADLLKMAIDIRSSSHSRLATSNSHLVHCTLDKIWIFNINDIDQQQQIFWDKDDWIIDICYSTLLKLFFIWSNSGFHTFDSLTMEKQQTIDNIPDTGTGWYRCTCYNDILLLSYDGDIEQRKIEIKVSEYTLVNKWKSTLNDENEIILCMKMNELRIALGIGKYGKTERFELRDHQMIILHDLHMDIGNISLLPNAKWLIITKSFNKLTVVNNDCAIEETISYNYRDTVLDAIIWGSNTLLIAIRNQLHFYDI